VEPNSKEHAEVVGVVGLGAMGGRFAIRLLDAGYKVHGTDRTATAAQSLIARGLHWQGTPREVAATADVVISMVTDDSALEAITTGPDGILAGLSPRTVYVDMSSVSPHASVQAAERVRAAGAHMIDAPVSGSVPQAEQARSRSSSVGTTRRSTGLSRCCATSAKRSPGSAETAPGYCSSWRSTSASPYRRWRSAKACWWPNTAASTHASPRGSWPTAPSVRRC
jgi:hypothetical protein